MYLHGRARGCIRYVEISRVWYNVSALRVHGTARSNNLLIADTYGCCKIKPSSNYASKPISFKSLDSDMET